MLRLSLVRAYCLIVHSFIFTLICTFTAPVWAVQNSDREIDWAHTLNLSSVQIKQISQYEQHYRQQLKQRIGDNCKDPELKFSITRDLKQQLHANIHSILSPEQKIEASMAIKEQHRQMQLSHARDLALLLALSKEQRVALYTDIEELDFNYQWPLNVQQRDKAKALFEQRLLAHLNNEQKQQWQQLLNKQQDKWHRSDEFSASCRS